MKVYLAVPLITNRSLDTANLIARTIKESGDELASPWVLSPSEPEKPSSEDVFTRDLFGSRNCDLLIADVSSPSTGVGMEVMAAHIAGRRIVLVCKRGAAISGMLRHMEPKRLIEFDDLPDLRRKVKAELSDAKEDRLF